jgi:hypothetical protein
MSSKRDMDFANAVREAKRHLDEAERIMWGFFGIGNDAERDRRRARAELFVDKALDALASHQTAREKHLIACLELADRVRCLS